MLCCDIAAVAWRHGHFNGQEPRNDGSRLDYPCLSGMTVFLSVEKMKPAGRKDRSTSFQKELIITLVLHDKNMLTNLLINLPRVIEPS